MSWSSFGDFSDEHGFRILDERVVRGSAGLMLFIGIIAAINGFILRNYVVLPYLSGFLAVNFLVGIFVSSKVAPTMALSKLLVRKQSPLPIGAIQKKFAWSLGLVLTTAIFGLSLLLVNDASWFEPVCMLCLICLLFLFLETAFGICVGCKLYFLAVKLKLLKPEPVTPNCMGDSCKVE